MIELWRPVVFDVSIRYEKEKKVILIRRQFHRTMLATKPLQFDLTLQDTEVILQDTTGYSNDSQRTFYIFSCGHATL